MRIAIIANNEHAVVPHTRFGVESYTYYLVNGLAKKHQVTLYAAGNSQVSARIVSVHPIGSAEDEKIKKEFIKFYQHWLNVEAYRNSDQYDIFHTNDPTTSIFYSFFSKIPTVSVIHSPWEEERYPIKVLEQLSRKNENHWLIAISKYQMRQIQKNIKNVKLVYHGIDLSVIDARYEDSFSYLSFLGRADKIKGIDIALEVAIKLGRQIKLSGTLPSSDKKVFFQNEIEFKLKNNKVAQYIGPILNVKDKFDFLSKSKALLFPIQWEEPFGLVIIETMACGTPVVAFARGSVPEVIKDGETGFIVNSSDDDKRGDWIVKKTGLDGLCEAVEKIYSMPEEQYRQMRRNCRAHVEKNFTVERMVDEYEKVYQEILSKK